MKTITNYCLTALLVCSIFGCNSDDPQPKDEQLESVSIEDPKAISDNLTFENGTATAVKEPFPEVSADAAAPQLPTSAEDLIGISGGQLTFDLNTITGSNIKGVYFKVEGADQYYDIVLQEAAGNGRILNSRKTTAEMTARAQNTSTLVISLPDGLEAGNFCITYAVYDDQNLVSNAVELCIDVKTHGGENSNFLTANVWAMEMEYWMGIDNGEAYGDTTVVGKTYKDSSTINFVCPGEATGTELTVNDEYLLEYYHMRLSTDGTVTIELTESGEEFDHETFCETGNKTYADEEEVFEETGSWSYNDDKKELTLVTKYKEYNVVELPDGSQSEETVTIHTSVAVYQVSQESGKLILTSEESGDWGSETEVAIFAPKK